MTTTDQAKINRRNAFYLEGIIMDLLYGSRVTKRTLKASLQNVTDPDGLASEAVALIEKALTAPVSYLGFGGTCGLEDAEYFRLQDLMKEFGALKSQGIESPVSLGQALAQMGARIDTTHTARTLH